MINIIYICMTKWWKMVLNYNLTQLFACDGDTCCHVDLSEWVHIFCQERSIFDTGHRNGNNGGIISIFKRFFFAWNTRKLSIYLSGKLASDWNMLIKIYNLLRISLKQLKLHFARLSCLFIQCCKIIFILGIIENYDLPKNVNIYSDSR